MAAEISYFALAAGELKYFEEYEAQGPLSVVCRVHGDEAEEMRKEIEERMGRPFFNKAVVELTTATGDKVVFQFFDFTMNIGTGLRAKGGKHASS